MNISTTEKVSDGIEVGLPLNHTDHCCECGRDVSTSSGHSINRVPDFNEPEDRQAMGRAFPYGDYVCASCDAVGV